jgi:vacuolar protein sorting-associated protein 52
VPQKIERPLASLLADICVPPSLAALILDTDVGEPWVTAIPEFDRILETSAARARVKAARDVAEVAEGLRIVVSRQCRQ